MRIPSDTRRTVRWIAAVALLALVARPIAVAAEPSSTQLALLFLRVLAFDRALKTRAGSELTLVILYKGGDSASEEMRSGITRSLESIRQKGQSFGIPIRLVNVPYTDAATLDARVGAEKAAAVYVCSGLDDHASAISGVTRRRSILSVTATESAVRSGLAVGLMPKSSRSMVLVNLAAARAEGADLDAKLLGISEVMR